MWKIFYLFMWIFLATTLLTVKTVYWKFSMLLLLISWFGLILSHREQ